MKIFLDDFGIFLGRKRNRFVVKQKDRKDEIVADNVDSIVCACQGVSMSASALNLAMTHNIQVVFARYGGWPYAILMPTAMTGSVRARREQFLAYNDERGYFLAKNFVAGKLANQANFLRLIAKNRKTTNPLLAQRIYDSGRAVSDIATRLASVTSGRIDEKRQELMNLEAEGARVYWGAIKEILPKELNFEGRETRGARDPFNVMLNFGYQTVLFPEVWKAVSHAGLDPYAGYLHADRPGKPSLVLDLMEEFRQQIVDRAVIGLLSRNIIKPNGILVVESPEEGRILSREVVKMLLMGLQERLDSEAMFDNQRAPLKSFIYSQARRVTRFLLNETTYIPFTLGW
ncbi:MAG: CRISPR-associated endonuclease Cas1 [Candidatus Bathyarchaeia archaeon]